MNATETAVDALLGGLIDYAGLFPPAGLDMQSAVRNYLEYRQGPHASALGRFVVNQTRIGELRAAAGDAVADMPLSVIVAAGADFTVVAEELDSAFHRSAFECKITEPADIERIASQLPERAECYFEIPLSPESEPLLDAIAAHGARAKLRMGGVTSEAFPSAEAVTGILHALAGRHIAFKATAGLHHPVRSRHPLTYEADSSEDVMHGFLNIAFAATEIHFGGPDAEALHTLEEEDLHAWQAAPEAIRCRAHLWSADQLRAVREHFFISFGSCSFQEPIRDLEAMGWL